MEFVQLSDLEEGEILEYDSYSPVDSSDDFEMKNRQLGSLKRDTDNYNIELKHPKERSFCLTQPEKHGYANKHLKEKLEVNGKLGKSHIGAIDLESISSEGEYKSEDENKLVAERRDCKCKNKVKRMKGKHSSHLYGTVEDIMSKIGETICRKSRCNFKKRKSKDFVKYSDNSYDVWRDKMFSSHLKGKSRKRKTRCSDSESEFSKNRIEKRKKRKKRDVYYEELSLAAKKPKMRDFDEMRRNLLEKLKKQKAEELKTSANASQPEVENSEIQEVDMLIDCTNYVDDPQRNSRAQEKDGEDELDLIKLRLIALASNKRRKSGGGNHSNHSESGAGDRTADDSSREEMDLDRNELLLRAEALKTALLKKHQKRLNVMRVEKPKTVGSSSDEVPPLPAPVQEDAALEDTETENAENALPSHEQNEEENSGELGQSMDSQSGPKEPSVWDGNPKKGNLRLKAKRKKRKLCSLANSLKENNERNEAAEEDDLTLRSQLLSDLMRKKCLKDLEKKSVLTDSIQTSANQIPVRNPWESLKGKRIRPPVMAKKNPLKKVNFVKMTKPGLPAKIPKPEIQRIIVHLGSNDSSDDSSGEEDGGGVAQNENGTGENVPTASANANGKPKEMIQANYEKSVELLLSQARRKVEGKMLTAKNNSTSNRTGTDLGAPEAVYKHLPPSQRLEYLRLKQKIAERERLRKEKRETSTNSAPGRPNTSAAQDTESQNPNQDTPQADSSSDSRDVTGLNVKLAAGLRSANGVVARPSATRLVSNKMKTNLAGLHGKGVKKHLAPASAGFKTPQTSSSVLLPSRQTLIMKLKLLLKKIKIEKMIEENYLKEILKLRSQLSLFERKKAEQRFKIKKLGEESVKTYRAIQGMTAKSSERAVAQEGNGGEENREGGTEQEDRTETEEGKSVPNEPETENRKAESNIDKEPNNHDGGDKVSETISGETSGVVGLLEYSSPLQVFTRSTDCPAVDPNVTMCQFDLMGICKDDECTYQHLRKS